jgi:Winged helix-turn helix
VSVNQMLSQWSGSRVLQFPSSRPDLRDITAIYRRKLLDKSLILIIISFTHTEGLAWRRKVAPAKGNPDKQQLLRLLGTLNLHPQDVTHPLFQDSDFFDPHDLVQVKYEMLRQARVDRRPVAQAAREFGFSRPSFYQAQFTFEQGGLSGLLPHKRGPKGGHKLTARVMRFVAEQRAAQPELSFTQLAELVKQNFDLQVHPRSIERQLLREKKR